MIEVRLPNINASSDSAKVQQISDYLFQLARQLNVTLSAIDENANHGGTKTTTDSKTGKMSKSSSTTPSAVSQRKAEDNFYTNRNLIVNTADIIEECAEVVERKLSSNYVAISEFGQYTETNDSVLTTTSEKATNAFKSIQKIINADGDVKELRNNNFYITTGWLDNNNSIGGIQIGVTKTVQTPDENGEIVTNVVDQSLARFTTSELAFYDPNGNKVTWFGINEVNMSNVNIKGRLDIGGYRTETTNGLAFKWAGD